MSDETKRLDIEAIEARAQRVYPAEGWSHEDAAHRARWVVRTDVPDLVAEVRRLREIIAGRTTPPTPEEIAAHCDAMGRWRVRYQNGTTSTVFGVWPGDLSRDGSPAVHFWALDADDRPCAWPVAPWRNWPITPWHECPTGPR